MPVNSIKILFQDYCPSWETCCMVRNMYSHAKITTAIPKLRTLVCIKEIWDLLVCKKAFVCWNWRLQWVLRMWGNKLQLGSIYTRLRVLWAQGKHVKGVRLSSWSRIHGRGWYSWHRSSLYRRTWNRARSIFRVGCRDACTKPLVYKCAFKESILSFAWERAPALGGGNWKRSSLLQRFVYFLCDCKYLGKGIQCAQVQRKLNP